jgi:hypothetical protein
MGSKQYIDTVFKLQWKKIVIKSPELPIKRSSHTMNLFMNRWLVLIGGETSIDEALPHEKENNGTEDIELNKSPVNSSEEESNNKALNDVWLYDIITNIWKEIKP